MNEQLLHFLEWLHERCAVALRYKWELNGEDTLYTHSELVEKYLNENDIKPEQPDFFRMIREGGTG